MTTKTLDATHMRLGKQTIHITGETVHDTVESWNWNLNIFEIYDLVRDWNNQDQENVLTYAYHYLGEDAMIKELADFLGHYNLKD